MEQWASVQNYEKYGFPHSTHPGGVNMAFCDGHVTTINETMDPLVYGQLMTSNRNRSRLIDYSQAVPMPERKMTPPADSSFRPHFTPVWERSSRRSALPRSHRLYVPQVLARIKLLDRLAVL